MPHLGGRAHGGLAPASAQSLLNRNRWRNAVHRVHFGTTCGLHDAARIGIEALQIPTLPFVEQNIKRQGGLARARNARDDIELAAWNVDAQVFQVVLFGIDDLDRVLTQRVSAARLRHRQSFARCGHCVMRVHRQGVIAQGLPGVRGGVVAHVFGCALGHQVAAFVAAFGSQIDEPIAGSNHIQVVLDHDQ